MYLIEGEKTIRLFEILLIIGTLGLLWGISFKLEFLERVKRPILVSNIILLILSLVVNGYRWQMIPVYVILTISIAILFFRKKEQSKLNTKLLFAGKLVVFLSALIIIVIPLYAFPVFSFKAPSGNYQVGTKSIMLSKDLDKKTKKDIMVQLYYPSENNKGKFADYSTDIDSLKSELARTQGMPNVLAGHLNQIKTHSYLEGKVVNHEKFPLLLFSHGMTLYNRQNTFQLEELASHGYIIAAVNYTKDSANTLFPNKPNVPYEDKELTLDYLDNHNLEWQEDASFVLDTLLNKKIKDFDDIIAQVEKEKIGTLGHSYGGATSTHLLINDKRVKAALNMDGGFYGPEIKDGDITKPFLLMNASDTIRHMKEGTDPLFEECFIRNDTVNQSGVYKLVLPNTDHGSFTDLAGFSPLITVKGANYKKTFQTINDISLAFFDKHLKQLNEEKLDSILDNRTDIEVTKY